ncbi:endonuclease domain-containing protein [Xanthomarina sp. F2636L]|uniref:endonuclease domain-containing protein n=1 Tax=Xanthomarina sp. F2636L TaxID=2996018 RepID=UPI00225DDE61|nr:endonuclease domain-containing protein [Xanthomarina sp. F2636L]MCX7549386.1 endonuclease domain-containing protein [Xanthomarina sp. F2636L]
MSKQNLHNKKEFQERRKQLRKNLTPAEAYLWTQLKSRQLDNRRFTKQHSIGHFIVDFYCASEKLIIELDGEVHNKPEAQEYDRKRSSYLENQGYKVIRFENNMVFDFLSSVLKEIRDNFNS